MPNEYIDRDMPPCPYCESEQTTYIGGWWSDSHCENCDRFFVADFAAFDAAIDDLKAVLVDEYRGVFDAIPYMEPDDWMLLFVFVAGVMTGLLLSTFVPVTA